MPKGYVDYLNRWCPECRHFCLYWGCDTFSEETGGESGYIHCERDNYASDETRPEELKIMSIFAKANSCDDFEEAE